MSVLDTGGGSRYKLRNLCEIDRSVDLAMNLVLICG